MTSGGKPRTVRRPRGSLDPARPRGGPLARGYAAAVVFARHLVIIGVVALAVVAANYRPEVPDTGNLRGFVSEDSAPVQTEIASATQFGFPLLSRTVIVQRAPEGLPPFAQAEAVLRAARLNQGEYPDARPLVGALPVTNTLQFFPSSSENGTTALTYVFAPPIVGFEEQTEAARRFATAHVNRPSDALVGVTGSIPARVEQARIVRKSLPLVEAATLLAIVAIVGLNFRSVVAPLLALVTAGLGYAITFGAAGLLASTAGARVPQELEPLIVALLLGVVTDYVIFFLSGFRGQLREGRSPREAARGAAADFGPIVAVAGLTVAAGTAALLVARSPLFRAFGPGMALTVVVGLAVSLLFVPAALALLGRWVFWPDRPDLSGGAAQGQMAGPGPADLFGRVFRRPRLITVMTWRPVALILVVVIVSGLAYAALPFRSAGLGLSFLPALPQNNEASVAADAAQKGFAPGILSPTVLLVRGEQVAAHPAELARLGNSIRTRPGVAGVLGPGDQLPAATQNVVVSRSGNAARYLVILDDEPLGASAVATLRHMREDLPRLLGQAGLPGARADFAGDTALAEDIVTGTKADLGRIALAALAVNLLLLVLFLRSLVAPLYLLASSVLALLASLGLTTYLFQDVLGHDGLTFYVPFAAAVLLVALGSDYNIFGVGHIWAEARDRPLREAIITAVPQTTRAITAAGVTLAASFGALALVPLRPFRELAFVMFIGILIDAIVVRSFLVPSLLVLVGRVSGWPGGRLSEGAEAGGSQEVPGRPVRRSPMEEAR